MHKCCVALHTQTSTRKKHGRQIAIGHLRTRRELAPRFLRTCANKCFELDWHKQKQATIVNFDWEWDGIELCKTTHLTYFDFNCSVLFISRCYPLSGLDPISTRWHRFGQEKKTHLSQVNTISRTGLVPHAQLLNNCFFFSLFLSTLPIQY